MPACTSLWRSDLRPRILITNSVPLNGGDEALLRATIEGLMRRWPRSSIRVLCSDVELCRKQLSDLSLYPDLEQITAAQTFGRHLVNALHRRFCLRNSITRWLSHSVDWITAKSTRREVLNLYRGCDLVISSPGGFFHDYYPIGDRLRGLDTALHWGKPVILLAQSIGPFWKRRSLKQVKNVFNRVSRICVRDSFSRKHLIGCGVDPNRIQETSDIAFLWRDLVPELFSKKSGPVKSIVLCFRKWPINDVVGTAKIVEKAAKLCEFLLADPSREIHFISSCQGLPGYVDDSELALAVLESLSPRLGSRCKIDRRRYTPRELIEVLGRHSMTVSMRLHVCILAMLGGAPAVGLGYEDKTAGIFGQLGLEAYQVGFQSDFCEWAACVTRLVEDLDLVRSRLPRLLEDGCSRARSNLDVVAELLPSEVVL